MVENSLKGSRWSRGRREWHDSVAKQKQDTVQIRGQAKTPDIGHGVVDHDNGLTAKV